MNKEALDKITKYKEFLAQQGCPENLPDYDNESYWDARYELEQQEAYDWYANWDKISPLFKEYIPPESKILELGTGKSSILSELSKEGYKNLIGSDFSWTLINQRRNEERYLKRGIRWERIDFTRPWPDFGVDCIFEKAGLDCLPAKEVKEVMNYIHKMTKKEGIFIHISTGTPQSRISLLKKWDVKVYEIPKVVIPMFSEIDDAKSYYIYICTK